MKHLIKTALVTFTLSAAAILPASAAEYSLDIRWDSNVSAAENHQNADAKIESYCRREIRRDFGRQVLGRHQAVKTCISQLKSDFVSKAP